jgi:nitric oxide reductase subunit C
VYSAWVFTKGTDKPELKFTGEMAKGKALWHKNNCISCHQLYGLGGYLGSDLTNVMSDEKRGRQYAESFLKSGGPRMPDFKFNDKEISQIMAYLSYVDSSAKPSMP